MSVPSSIVLRIPKKDPSENPGSSMILLLTSFSSLCSVSRVLRAPGAARNETSPLIIPPGNGVSNLINHRLTGLIGYTFQDPALLTDALTHALCEYNTSTQSYQRPEFLGDTVLDMVVMAVIATHPGNGSGTNDIAQTFHRERQPP